MKLSDLTQMRREHVKSCHANNDKSHEMISGLYSDPSHFIYEILQNADDARASEVIFKLTRKALSITHDGNKLFTIEDVDSITTVGSSTKKNDVNSIGTFGAGFKSVFAITKTPRIHSGGFNFQITDYIVPEEIEPTSIEPEATQITLPFDHPKIYSDAAYENISDYLQTLESESLLFLRHIKEIQWSTRTDKGHYLSEINGNKASLISQVNNDEGSLKEYFLCTKDITIDNANLNLVVAYLLDSDGAVTSCDSKLFVFFPTKETTGFKFLVHAPYKTTPSRDAIPFDDSQNKFITRELSALVAESIKELKDSELLDVDVLSILPIQSDNKHPLYSSAFDQVKSMFEKESLLPTSSGGYEKAENTLLAREKELTNLLESTDCSELFNRNTWLSTDITRDKTGELRDYLIDELDIPEITMDKFCSDINNDFIKIKSDKWLINFYSSITDNEALYRQKKPWESKGVLRDRPIIRLEDGSHINPDDDSGDIQVYLPTNRESKFKTVKRVLAAQEASYEFLEKLGLEQPDNIAEIKEFIIPRYQGKCIDLNEYTEDFERVLGMWSQSDEYQKKNIVDLLKETQFIRCVTKNGGTSYQMPEQVYFPTEKLSTWFDKNSVDNVCFLDSSTELPEQKRKFIESLGVKYELKILGSSDIIVDGYGWHERSVNGFNPEFDIHGLEYSLNNISFERSVLLWTVLIKNTNKLRGYIGTRTNQNDPYNKGELKTSKAMDLLNNTPWLYARSGELLDRPIDQITLDDLDDKYLKEDDNVEKLVKVLGLKLNEILEFEQRTGLKAVTKEKYDAFEKWEQEQTADSDESTSVSDWTPEADPDDAIPIQDDADWIKRKTEDLSGQGATEDSTDSGQENNDHEENSNDHESVSPKNSKKIGGWGEDVANKYLMAKYPKYEVIWLNKNGGIGKGYDFVIKNNGEDIYYYEIKSKTEKSPKLFQVSGTQWNWAKQLHSSKKGDMYKILVISNAGTKQPIIREINNPVGLWESGELYADPVSIEL